MSGCSTKPNTPTLNCNPELDCGIQAYDLARIVDQIALVPQIKEAILFGSRAKGNFRPGSDIDIALKGEGLTLHHILQLLNAFDDLMLPYLFDVVIYDRIQEPALTLHIDQCGRVIYRRN